MLLTVNVGNTNCAFGLFEQGVLREHGGVANRDLALLPQAIGEVCVQQIALASVAPTRTEQVIPLLAGAFRQTVLLAGRDLPFTMDIQCDEPEKVGVDRLVNAVAAHARTQSAVVVVDAGTAVTVDLVSARGSFCGGAIAPGPGAMLRALAREAEQLPRVSLDKPQDPVGRNTTEAMRAGAWYGTIGLVRELVARIAARQSDRIPILVTGGAGEWIARALGPQAEHVPHLGLEGLALLVSTASAGSR